MNYWYVWPIGIVLWLALGWCEFGVIEGRALSAKAGPKQITLSMFIYTVATKFPLAAIIGASAVAFFFGILYTHFFWHWCPPGSVSTG
jgi:hypothetical protein